MTPREIALVVVAAVSLSLAGFALHLARDHSDPRRALDRNIRAMTSPRDLVVFTDESPERVEFMYPTPALYGSIPLGDLRPFDTLWVIADRSASLAPYTARFGAGRPIGTNDTNGTNGTVMAWSLRRDGLSKVLWSVTDHVGVGVTAKREGGADGGPCPFANGRLVCHGPDWNQPRTEVHRFDGTDVMCLYAHPQADGALVFSLNGIPAGRRVVGAVGIDDAGYFPAGAPVTMAVHWSPAGHPPIEHTVTAPNRKGITPWAITVPATMATATISVTTPNAGARQFCFTLVVTE